MQYLRHVGSLGSAWTETGGGSAVVLALTGAGTIEENHHDHSMASFFACLRVLDSGRNLLLFLRQRAYRTYRLYSAVRDNQSPITLPGQAQEVIKPKTGALTPSCFCQDIVLQFFSRVASLSVCTPWGKTRKRFGGKEKTSLIQ